MIYSFKNQDELIDCYLEQKQSSGKCGNVFFENNKLYSYGYHYVLSIINEDKIVINNRKYSISTTKQCSKVVYLSKTFIQEFKYF